LLRLQAASPKHKRDVNHHHNRGEDNRLDDVVHLISPESPSVDERWAFLGLLILIEAGPSFVRLKLIVFRLKAETERRSFPRLQVSLDRHCAKK
jgi:hypothetical protein